MHLQARRYEDLPKEIALIELRNDMRQKVPCIGECVMFNAKTSKKKSICNMQLSKKRRRAHD
jgi:hypothetical protein